ncbi:hypothetical protein [Streptomyces sp. NBC_00370]|uniref:hypothetical protein n=1 Tax=Streptomyces sp. NBC_00370 TaxID=2975728 RepID=UPI002E266A2B
MLDPELFLKLGDAGPRVVFGLGDALGGPLLSSVRPGCPLLVGCSDGIVALDEHALGLPQSLLESLDTRLRVIALPPQPLVGFVLTLLGPGRALGHDP